MGETDGVSVDAGDLLRRLLEANMEVERLRARLCRHGWRGSSISEAIVTPCPTCGLRSLFIGSGGHLTCASVPTDLSPGCPEPVVEDAVEELKTRIDRLQAELELERGKEP